MLLKNVASQGVFLYAVDTTVAPYGPKTGDAGNITGSNSLDGVDDIGFDTANPTEMGGGVYWQPLSQAETNGDSYAYRWVSSTTGIFINPVFGVTSGINLPNIAYNSSGGLITSGTGTGQLSVSGGHAILQATGLDLIIKDTYTLPELIELIAAITLAKCSGLPTSPVTIRSVDDTANRVVTHFDTNNNRTSVTLTP